MKRIIIRYVVSAVICITSVRPFASYKVLLGLCLIWTASLAAELFDCNKNRSEKPSQTDEPPIDKDDLIEKHHQLGQLQYGLTIRRNMLRAGELSEEEYIEFYRQYLDFRITNQL